MCFWVCFVECSDFEFADILVFVVWVVAGLISLRLCWVALFCWLVGVVVIWWVAFCIWFCWWVGSCSLLVGDLWDLPWWFRFLYSWCWFDFLVLDFIDCLRFVVCGMILVFLVGVLLDLILCYFGSRWFCVCVGLRGLGGL